MSGGELRGGSSGSSRRGKKSESSQNSEKPKQPQRGLGVAQLEKIRLHSQMEEMKMQAYAAMQSSMGLPPHLAYSSPQSSTITPTYGYPPNNMIGIDVERSNSLKFCETRTQPTWNPSHGFPGSQPYGPPGMATRHFLDEIEDPELNMRNNWLEIAMAGSSGQSSGSGEDQDLDLELKL